MARNVDAQNDAEGIRRQIQLAVPQLLAKAGLQQVQIRGIGIGFGGPVDDTTNTIVKSHQVQGWDNFPLTACLSDMLGWPAVMGNDADVAGLAEALFGAGRGLSPIFYITIGSGIGGGLIVTGEIYRGSGRGAAEIGHLRIFDPKTKTIDILENYASGWAIGRVPDVISGYRLGDEFVPFWNSSEELRNMTAKTVADAAGAGNKLARRILDQAWDALAEGICSVIALLGPRRMIIGGGVSLMGESLLFEPLRTKVSARVFKPYAGCYDIVQAALGEEVVVHGAPGASQGPIQRLVFG